MMGCALFQFESVERETVEIGYRFHPDHHHRGYATEACEVLVRFLFDRIEVHKITALCDLANTPSLRLLERIGMQREAHLRQYSRRDDEWQDAVE